MNKTDKHHNENLENKNTNFVHETDRVVASASRVRRTWSPARREAYEKSKLARIGTFAPKAESQPEPLPNVNDEAPSFDETADVHESVDALNADNAAEMLDKGDQDEEDGAEEAVVLDDRYAYDHMYMFFAMRKKIPLKTWVRAYQTIHEWLLSNGVEKDDIPEDSVELVAFFRKFRQKKRRRRLALLYKLGYVLVKKSPVRFPVRPGFQVDSLTTPFRRVREERRVNFENWRRARNKKADFVVMWNMRRGFGNRLFNPTEPKGLLFVKAPIYPYVILRNLLKKVRRARRRKSRRVKNRYMRYTAKMKSKLFEAERRKRLRDRGPASASHFTKLRVLLRERRAYYLYLRHLSARRKWKAYFRDVLRVQLNRIKQQSDIGKNTMLYHEERPFKEWRSADPKDPETYEDAPQLIFATPDGLDAYAAYIAFLMCPRKFLGNEEEVRAAVLNSEKYQEELSHIEASKNVFLRKRLDELTFEEVLLYGFDYLEELPAGRNKRTEGPGWARQRVSVNVSAEQLKHKDRQASRAVKKLTKLLKAVPAPVTPQQTEITPLSKQSGDNSGVYSAVDAEGLEQDPIFDKNHHLLAFFYTSNDLDEYIATDAVKSSLQDAALNQSAAYLLDTLARGQVGTLDGVFYELASWFSDEISADRTSLENDWQEPYASEDEMEEFAEVEASNQGWEESDTLDYVREDVEPISQSNFTDPWISSKVDAYEGGSPSYAPFVLSSFAKLHDYQETAFAEQRNFCKLDSLSPLTSEYSNPEDCGLDDELFFQLVEGAEIEQKKALQAAAETENSLSATENTDSTTAASKKKTAQQFGVDGWSPARRAAYNKKKGIL